MIEAVTQASQMATWATKEQARHWETGLFFFIAK